MEHTEKQERMNWCFQRNVFPTLPENGAFSLHRQKDIANRYASENRIKKNQSERKFWQASEILKLLDP